MISKKFEDHRSIILSVTGKPLLQSFQTELDELKIKIDNELDNRLRGGVWVCDEEVAVTVIINNLEKMK